jgi:hypothetical protein
MPGGGMPGGGMPGGGMPGGGMPGGGMPGGQQKEPPSIMVIRYRTHLFGSTVALDLDLVQINALLANQVTSYLDPYLVSLHGFLERATSHPSPHELGLAAVDFDKAKGQFPRGTYDRKPEARRGNRPWPPDQRVSWLAELLPFLPGGGYQGVYDKIKINKSWRDSDNRVPALTIIPAFLDGDSPSSSWYVEIPGQDHPAAATHYVGIAGIGMDAPYYDKTDAALAKKLGIFGFDRVTRLSDITDGVANTILMAQVPPVYRSPWLAGGGSTVRGVPEKNSVRPFVCIKGADGGRGTHVVMADGSVRFVSEKISDEVFKAMVTYKGGEPDQKLNERAPIIPPPEGGIVPPTTKPAGQPVAQLPAR